MAFMGTTISGTAGGGAQILLSGALTSVIMDVVIRNVDSGTIYLGGNAVSPMQGFPLNPNDSLSFTCLNSETLYGTVATSGTVQCRVFLRGVA